MNREPHPQTILGESIRAFAAEVDEVTRRVASLQLPDRGADAGTFAESARALVEAAEALARAHAELDAEKQILKELIDEERLRYSDLFHWAPEAYVVTDRAGIVLDANRAAEDLFRYPRGILVGGLITRLLPVAERAAFRSVLARMPMLEAVTDWELQLARRDQTVFTAAVTVGWLADRAGRTGSLRWLIRDVSERKAAEDRIVSANLDLERRVGERTEQLQAAANERETAYGRLEAVLDQIPAGIVIADAASGSIVAANGHAQRLVEDVVGRGNALDAWLTIGFHPDGRPIAPDERPIMQALTSGETVKGLEIEFQRLDGTRVLYETSAAPIRNAAGEVAGAVAAYWDLTERVRLARAEREFVTNAAHELRTPLAALASAVEVLQAGAKEDPHQRERFLAHVEQQSDRLQRLVRSLLLLARLQTLQEKADREPIAVDSLLAEVAVSGPAGRIRVELNCPPGTLVLANRDLVEQALLNLVSNAAKYAPEGEIVLSGRSQNGVVSLEVADRGPGMSSEQRKRALERFYRGRDDADGFGLGLSIVQQAAEALDGRLELERNGSRGTRARILLPAADADA